MKCSADARAPAAPDRSTTTTTVRRGFQRLPALRPSPRAHPPRCASEITTELPRATITSPRAMMMISPCRSAKCPVRMIHSPVPAIKVAPMNVERAGDPDHHAGVAVEERTEHDEAHRARTRRSVAERAAEDVAVGLERQHHHRQRGQEDRGEGQGEQQSSTVERRGDRCRHRNARRRWPAGTAPGPDVNCPRRRWPTT